MMAEKTPEEIALERIQTAASKGLHTLDLRGIHLATLPAEIGQLTHLTTLLLRKHQLITLPPEIRQLTNLSFLELNFGRLKQLPAEIGHLTKLTSLALSGNNLTTLPPEFQRLTNLTHLDLSSNQLTNLPPEIKKFTNLKSLYMDGNPFLVEPEEIIEKTSTLLNLTYLTFPGEKHRPSVITTYDWLWAMRRKRNLFGEAKIFVVGNRGAGKTSLVRHLTLDEFDRWEPNTEGIAFYRILHRRLPHSPWVNIWDFGGQELLRPMHEFFPTHPNLYLLVLDTQLSQDENRVADWLKLLQSLSKDTPVLIVGNQSDRHPFEIDHRKLQDQYPQIVSILEISAVTRRGVEELKTRIASHLDSLIYLHPHEVIDPMYDSPSFKDWLSLKGDIERLSEKRSYISYDEYFEIYNNHHRLHYDQGHPEFMSALHDLGIVFYFQDSPQLNSLIMLQPHKIIKGMYIILNSQALLDNNRILPVGMINAILQKTGYQEIERKYILNLMQKFELCHEMENNLTFFFPDLVA